MDAEKYTVWSIILLVTLFIFYYKVRQGKIEDKDILGLRELQIQNSKKVGFQLKQQKKSQFSKTCLPMLSSGSYQNKSIFSSNHSDLISECSKSESCKANAWLPSPECTWHQYSTEDARQCFKNKKIQVIGDSRARQLYLGMKDRLEGKGWVYDVDGLFLGKHVCRAILVCCVCWS